MLKLGIALNRTQKRIITSSNFDANAAAFITAASITNANQQNAINDLCIGLKIAGLFNKCLAIYPFVGGNATSHSFNLANVSTYQITFNGGWTHTADGALSNGVNGYANTGFNPNTNLTFNSNHISFYDNTGIGQVTLQRYNMGSSDDAGAVVNELALIIKFNTNIAYYTADAGYNCSFTPVGPNRGLSLGTMNSTSTQVYYINGGAAANAISPGNTLSTQPIYIGAFNAGGVAIQNSDYRTAFCSIGTGFSAAEASTFYTLVQNYQIALLRQV